MPLSRLFLVVSCCLAFTCLRAAGDEPAKPVIRRVAVIPLQNLRNDASADWIGSGASETLTTKLAGVNGLVMIERAQVARVMREQDIKIQQNPDDVNLAMKLGKVIAADRMVVGSFMKAGKDIVFNVRVVDVTSGLVLNTASLKAVEADIMDAMFQLAEAVVQSFDKKVVMVDRTPTAQAAPASERLELTEEQRKRLKDFGTASAEAYAAMMKGLEKDDPEAMVRGCTKAIELDPQYAAAYNNRSVAYFRLAKYDKALADSHKAVKLDAAEAMNYCNRGVVYQKLGQSDKAIADLTKAIEVNNRIAIFYSNRGGIMSEIGRHKEASADLAHAIELAPTEPFAYINRGLDLARIGDPAKGLADVNFAIKLAPSDALAYASRGWLKYNMGKEEEALGDYAKALELDPRNLEAWAHRANLYARRGDAQKAIRNYDTVIELDPGRCSAYLGRGSMYYAVDEYRKSLADFNKAIELNDQNPDAYERRAGTLYMLKQTGKAWADIQTAEKLGGKVDPKVKAAILKALRE